MTIRAHLAYTIPVGLGASLAALSAELEAIPLPQSVIDALSCFVESDVTSGDTRTIILRYSPTTPATATAQLVAGDPTGSPIDHFTITLAGVDYVTPPRVDINDPTGSGALGRCFLKVVSAAQISGGTGYTGATAVSFVGGLKPATVPHFQTPQGGGVAATGHATIVAGVITAIVVDTPGSGYTSPPQIVITDSGGGSGAVFRAQMGIDGLEVVRPGSGYTAPIVNFLPTFYTMFGALPPSQAKPFFNLFRQLFQQKLASGITAAAPLIT